MFIKLIGFKLNGDFMDKKAKKLLREHGYTYEQILEMDTKIKRNKYVAVYHRYSRHEFEVFNKYNEAKSFLKYGHDNGEIIALGLLSSKGIEWEPDFFD